MPLTEPRDGHVTITEDPDDSEPRCCCCCCKRKCCKCTKEKCCNALQVILILIGAGAGFGVGVALRFIPPFDEPERHPREMMYLYFPAELLLRLISFISIPLIVSSLVCGIGALDSTTAAKIGLRTLVYYICTTVLAVCEGFALVYAIQPARYVTLEKLGQHFAQVHFNGTEFDSDMDILLDFFRNLFPDNVVTLAFQMTKSETRMKPLQLPNETIWIEDTHLHHVTAINLLGLIVVAMAFGIAMSALDRRQAKPIVMLFDSLFEVTHKLFKALMWLYPILVFFLLMHTAIQLRDPIGYLLSMYVYLLTVLAGLFTHAAIILPLLYLIIARRNPFKLVCGCLKALLTAFATSNSTATLPATMHCLERMCVHRRIVRFACPVGASVNMDGFALYEGMAVIFVATLNGLTPSPVEFITLGFLSVAISIGAPMLGSGAILYVLLFKALGLPLRDIGLLLPFEWILSRLRTTTNVWGDCVGAGIVQSLSRRELMGAGSGYIDDEDGESDGEADGPGVDGPVLTRYQHQGARGDWTVRLVNENGEKLVVSKV